LMSPLMRAELAAPALQFFSNEQYNQLFTIHGTIMLLLYATPLLFGFANVALPLQIGAPDVAFPRLNAFSYWVFLFGGLLVLSGFITPAGAPDFGWTGYTPLSDAVHSPGPGGDLWIMGLIVSWLGTILGAVNMVTTVVCLRAPGMTMFRLPIFTWNILATSPHLRPGQRRSNPLAAPVLVLRPPRCVGTGPEGQRPGRPSCSVAAPSVTVAGGRRRNSRPRRLARLQTGTTSMRLSNPSKSAALRV
jgi:hypothetical protein